MTRTALTDLQLTVMKALWEVGEGSLAEVLAALAPDSGSLAPTTVATMLQRLSKQGWVSMRKVGRQFVYKAQVGEQQAARGALQRVVRSFFGGSLSALTAQLLASEQCTPEELEQMRRLLEKKT